MLAAIILAAGASQRMGTPKALLRYRGTTFLGAVLDAARAVGVGRQVVVLRADADNILAQVELGDATVLLNPHPESGPIGSLRLGLAAIFNHPVDGALVWHVDRPHVTVATVERLVDRFRQQDGAIVVPRFGSKRGHPVVFGRAAFAELLTVPEALGARAVVRRDPARVVEVAVDDAAILEDIDTPEDYEALLRRSDAGRG